MRASEFEIVNENDRLDEIGPLISIAGWFAKKYHDVLATGSQKLGAGKIQSFTNEHLRTFMKFMGMNRVDWPTLTPYIVYRYMRLFMKLTNRQILNVFNTVVIDPTVRGRKITSIDEIRDAGKNNPLSNLSSVGGDPKKTAQLIGEKLIAAGAVQQVNNHWDDEAKSNTNKKPKPKSQSGTATAQAAPTQAEPKSKEEVVIKTASDGEQYRLHIGKTGDRLWINTKTSDAASDEIDAELEKD